MGILIFHVLFRHSKVKYPIKVTSLRFLWLSSEARTAILHIALKLFFQYMCIRLDAFVRFIESLHFVSISSVNVGMINFSELKIF